MDKQADTFWQAEAETNRQAGRQTSRLIWRTYMREQETRESQDTRERQDTVGADPFAVIWIGNAAFPESTITVEGGE